MASSAHAQKSAESGAPTPPAAVSTAAPGDAALSRARAAWDKGDYDVAEPLYREAIETGGLAPKDVLDAYVHLGATRAVIGKKESALAAFKAAAIIDNQFVVPPEAGKRALALADRARRAEARIGSIVLHADVPADLGVGESAQIDATLDGPHAVIASKVALFARDSLSNKSYADSQDAAQVVHFKLPSSMSLPSATLVVRVDALDMHANRIASVEQRVRVKAAVEPAPVAVLPRALGGGAPEADTSKTTGDSRKSEGGFWSSPWPYVIGGAALAAGGAAVYFATRPTDDVNVGAVRVQLGR